MKHHLICLTVDTDPDGLSGLQTNRRALRWDGLEYLLQHPKQLASLQLPLTWFVRADGQLSEAFGSPLYLFYRYQHFWNHVVDLGHEIGWHPHLYRQVTRESEPELITDTIEACAELQEMGNRLQRLPYPFCSFRNGEGWHTPQTFTAVEAMGFTCDSTAIPGRDDSPLHPRNWRGTPNQPYFPDSVDIRLPGAARAMLEIPMNTWYFQTSYDQQPRLRYMNPCIHPSLFNRALEDWQTTLPQIHANLCIWTLIFHPEEVAPSPNPNPLYARSFVALIQNLSAIQQRLASLGHSYEFVTMRDAVYRWRLRQN